ncbi:hypothetical protein CALCODRAFT_502818 [Calocera cornea HHB12733]|uniref:Uncharacterized protein n=1 Tax=Calocera cornea HHB12733 TaxID=1353952 RepID=A0A165D489_9BASI|nr:hypothetical protein CALCODRAFT_502818 [Calocera cornea HHB12733]
MSVLSLIPAGTLAIVVCKWRHLNSDLPMIGIDPRNHLWGGWGYKYMVALGTGIGGPDWLLAEIEGDHCKVSFQRTNIFRRARPAVAVLQITRPHPYWQRSIEHLCQVLQDETFTCPEGDLFTLDAEGFMNQLRMSEWLADEVVRYVHPSKVMYDRVFEEMGAREIANAFTTSEAEEDANFIRSAWQGAAPRSSPQEYLESRADLILAEPPSDPESSPAE